MRLIAATQTSRRYMRGQARGKLGTCNQMLRMLQMPKEGCFAFSDSRPTFEYSPSRWKSPLCIAKQPVCHNWPRVLPKAPTYPTSRCGKRHCMRNGRVKRGSVIPATELRHKPACNRCCNRRLKPMSRASCWICRGIRVVMLRSAPLPWTWHNCD